MQSHTADPAAAAVSGVGTLPLLSHALDQARRRRAGESVTLADYERTSGIERAVAESAQHAYGTLTSAQQVVARRIFTRITVTGTNGTDTAARVRRADLAAVAGSAEDIDTVLEAFARERLLTLAVDTVEISHEALLTAWPLLRDTWLAETRDTRAVRTRLATDAAEWNRHHRDPAYLYSGSVLGTAADAADRIRIDLARYPPLADIETQFLAAGTRAHRRRVRQRRAITRPPGCAGARVDRGHGYRAIGQPPIRPAA